MSTFAVMFLAVASCLAAGTALWIAWILVDSQRRLQQKKASVLRAQLIAQLHSIRDSIVPRARALDALHKEIYEPLQFLWVQADLLEPEEIHAVNRCSSIVLALRHKLSLNQTQARLAHRAIDEACAILVRSEASINQRGRYWSPAHRLMKRFPGFASIDMDGVVPTQQPGAVSQIGVVKG